MKGITWATSSKGLQLGLLLAFACCLFTGSSVNAASQYDDLVNTTESAAIKHNGSQTYYMTRDNSFIADHCSSQISAIWENSKSSPDFTYLLAEWRQYAPGDYGAYLWFSNDVMSGYTFQQMGGEDAFVRLPANYHRIKVDYESWDYTDNTPNCQYVNNTLAAPGEALMYRSTKQNWAVVSTNMPIQYPDGYEGSLERDLPDAPPVPDLTDDISFYYKVEGKKLTVVGKTQQPPLDLSTMTCRWQMSTQDWGVVMDKITPCDEENYQQYTFEDYGLVQVNYDILYDINGDGVILPEESIGSIQRNLNLDGSYYDGMTGATWDAPKSDYKDCSTYGTDLIGGIGCHIFNLGITIRNFFIPDQKALAAEISDFNGYMETQLGFVWQAFAMPIDLMTQVADGFATPDSSLSLGTLSGQNVSIDLGQVRNMVGAAPFDMALNIFRGVVALTFIFSAARYANRFFSNREGATA